MNIGIRFRILTQQTDAHIAHHSGIQSGVTVLRLACMCIRSEKFKFQRIQCQFFSTQPVLRGRMKHHRNIHIIKDMGITHGHLSAEVFLCRCTDHTHFAADLIDHCF